MARPKTKEELLNLADSNFHKLNAFIDSLSLKQQESEFPPGTMNRNIRDVLGHLYHWHLMMLRWYKEGMAGEKTDMPAKGYTWKTTPKLNKWILEKYQNIKLSQAKDLFKNSHQEVYQLIINHSDDELFEKKRYKWTGSTSLGAYLISSTSSHYDWAFKLIKKAFK